VPYTNGIQPPVSDRRRREGSNKIYLRKIGCIRLQGRDKWQITVKSTLNPRISHNARTLLNSWANIIFSQVTQIMKVNSRGLTIFFTVTEERILVFSWPKQLWNETTAINGRFKNGRSSKLRSSEHSYKGTCITHNPVLLVYDMTYSYFGPGYFTTLHQLLFIQYRDEWEQNNPQRDGSTKKGTVISYFQVQPWH